MGKFIWKNIVFLLFPIFTLFVVFLLEDGTTDPFYQRFTTTKKSSLIIGTSKAAQGLIPSIINESLGLTGEDEIFNYSFTISASPYGTVYNNSILEKLDSSTENGIFIVSVDPWSISANKIDPNNEEFFVENSGILKNLKFVNGKINFQYLLFYYKKSFYEILLSPLNRKIMKLHKNGWLEISIEKEGGNYNERLNNKIKDLQIKLETHTFSSQRLLSLNQLISFLKTKGNVYLVRMPVDPKILEIDNKVIPEFDSVIFELCESHQISYLDFSNQSSLFLYTDGNHLDKRSGKEVSLQVGNWIKNVSVKSN